MEENRKEDKSLTEPKNRLSSSDHRRPKIWRFFRKILKEDSTLSILKISATALTAVSMALISTRLTTVVNSLVLVALVSALTAIVSEFYRVILSFTSHGAKKVILTRLLTNPDGSTTETPIVTPEIVSISSERIEEISEQHERGGSIRRYLRMNPLMKTILIFTMISAATIISSYFISSSSSKAPVNNYTTVQQPLEIITDSEKQKIIDAAVGTSLSGVSTEKADLQSQIDSLEKSNTELSKSLEDFKKEKELLDRSIMRVEEKLKKIESRLDSEPKNIPSPIKIPDALEPSAKPTPTPTPIFTAPNPE